MAYKLYGREVFRATVDGREFTFTCYSQGTRYGFRHICCEGYSDTEVARYVKDKIIGKACYYNRTWESFKYETVLRKAINNLYESDEVKAKLRAIIIDKTEQEERERCEAQVKAFETLWNGLSEKNKEHIRNGVGENGIQSDEQAQTVMGVMQMMSLLQD